MKQAGVWILISLLGLRFFELLQMESSKPPKITIQEFGGWQTLTMVERYSHLSPHHKARAIERLAEFSHTNAAVTLLSS